MFTVERESLAQSLGGWGCRPWRGMLRFNLFSGRTLGSETCAAFPLPWNNKPVH